MTRRQRLRPHDRGVSTAVTHVLAIGITAILISGLLFAAASVLGDQRQSAARQELKTVGNRIADHISMADQIVDNKGGNSNGEPQMVRLVLNQPSTIAGKSYTVKVTKGKCTKYQGKQPSHAAGNPAKDHEACIKLTHSDVRGGRVEVPVEIDNDDDGNIKIAVLNEGSGKFVVVACDIDSDTSLGNSCPYSSGNIF